MVPTSAKLINPMRVYKFLKKCCGIQALRQKRLKQSRVNDLNDPFELKPYDLSVSGSCFPRRAIRCIKTRACCASARIGRTLSCGHIMPTGKRDSALASISRIPTAVRTVRLCVFDTSDTRYSFHLTSTQLRNNCRSRNALSTKFKDWAYEEEIRIWGQLQNECGGYTSSILATASICAR